MTRCLVEFTSTNFIDISSASFGRFDSLHADEIKEIDIPKSVDENLKWQNVHHEGIPNISE